MSKINTNELCKNFSAAIQKKVGYPRGLREMYPDDTFALSDLFGGRSSGAVYKLETPGFTAEYIRAESESSRVTGDTTTEWESLTITYGEKSKFKASRIRGGHIEHFGPGEIFLGSKKIEPQKWKVSSGKRPVTLIENYLKQQSNAQKGPAAA